MGKFEKIKKIEKNRNALLKWLKKRTKIELIGLVFLSFVVISSIIYTQFLAYKMAEREKEQVALWAKATQNKAKLLKLSNEIFQKLSEEERIKVLLYSKASKQILSENDNEKLSLLLDIIKLNENIPTISADNKNIVMDMRNTENMSVKIGDTIAGKKYEAFLKRKPIEISWRGSKQAIYYTDSKIFKELQYFLNTSGDNFYDEIGSNSVFLPVLLTTASDSILLAGNIDSARLSTEKSKIELLNDFKSQSTPLKINLGNGEIQNLYYLNSPIISQLRWFPIVLYTILGVLLISVYISFKNILSHEKNLIWVGMSKETAHQLGTPLLSLGGWIELLKEKEHQKIAPIIAEMEKDIDRLSLVADRFGKIGSKPKLDFESIIPIIEDAINYFRLRSSDTIKLTSFWNTNLYSKALINKPLFDWVIENLIRNAIDSINSEIGFIEIHCSTQNDLFIIEIKDSGKGIAPENFDKVFEPGFTTKKRGWGLGLSLCKRIVEEYFDGKIMVAHSEINKGTTFRIELKQK